MTQDSARRFVRVFEEFGDSKHVTSRGLGINALYELVQIPPTEREVEHITSKGETKTPAEMTVNFTQRHANRFIRVYERFSKLHTGVANVSLVKQLPSVMSVLYELPWADQITRRRVI